MIFYGLEFKPLKLTDMTTFKKAYVGKGQMPNEKMDIIRITMKMEDLKEIAYQYQEEEMVTVEVARMQNPDKFGRTHTVYANIKETVEKEEKKTSGKKGKNK